MKDCLHCLRFERLTSDVGKCRLHNKEVKVNDYCEDYASDVTFLNSKEGWFVVCGRQRLGAFKSLRGIDPVEVAGKLKVHPKNVFKAKLRMLKEPSEQLEKFDDTVEVNGLTVHPVFNGLLKKVHPVIGVINGSAYILSLIHI